MSQRRSVLPSTELAGITGPRRLPVVAVVGLSTKGDTGWNWNLRYAAVSVVFDGDTFGTFNKCLI